jgi:hypothetical protein
LNFALASISGLPPSKMSVPRPAMLVDTVTPPLRPACATTSASFSWCFALSTWWGTFFLSSMRCDGVALLDARGAHQHGLPALVRVEDLGHHGRELLFLGLVDDVLVIDAHDVLVRGDRDDVELVGRVKLGGLGVGGAGHARELLVDAEEVLERDRRERAALFLMRTFSFASTAWCRPSDQRRPASLRPVNSSTMTTLPCSTR